MDRREIVRVFRERLGQVIATSGASRSAFAARVGLDRSTLSQLLAPDNERLPRAETIARIAASAQVSVDWLLGLSQVGQLGTDVVTQALEIEPGAGSPADERLQRWHAEAAGYKIRYVPSTVPDMLKTEEVIYYEYAEYGGRVPQTRVQVAEQRLAYSRRPETDTEVCSSFQSIEELARGEGIWRLLPLRERKAQIQVMIDLLEELYPTLRWFLFDGLRQYCVPLTLFGPLRAAAYFGDMYFVFNSTEHVRVLTRHFDDLIRVATVQPPDVPDLLRRMLEDLPDDRPTPVPQGSRP
jgi:transcriptional regulator with XRE-family HTH domain